MFERIADEPPDFQLLFKKVMKYHFDWSQVEPTQQARAKQVREWIVTAADNLRKAERGHDVNSAN